MSSKKFWPVIIFVFVGLIFVATQINPSDYEMLFYGKYKNQKGITSILGYKVGKDKVDKYDLQSHCKKEYGGYTECFYYREKLELTHLSSMKPFEAIEAALKTNYFARVSLSVDGKKTEYFEKGKPSK